MFIISYIFKKKKQNKKGGKWELKALRSSDVMCSRYSSPNQYIQFDMNNKSLYY